MDGVLEVVKFIDGRYGIRNTWTGIILTNDDDTVRSYRKARRAFRVMRRLERNLQRTFRDITKQSQGAS